MASPAAPSAQTNTVTLSIAQGESANPTATFSHAMAARMVTVGSGAAAHWKIRAHGVEPLHAELYWDGNILWIRNGGSLSGTYVGGNRADDWAQVFDGTEVLLGSARITSKVVGPDARNPAVSAPGAATRNAGYMDEEESTMVFSNNMNLARAAASVPAPPKPSTAAPVPQPSQPAPSHGRIGTMAPPMASSTPAAVAPPRPNAPGPGPAPSPARASAPPAPAPPPPAEDPPQKPASSEATVIRPSPYAALEAAGMLGPLPAAGNRNPMPAELRTIAPGVVNASSVVVSASAVSLPVVTPQGVRPGTMAPQVSASLQPVVAATMAQHPMSSGVSSPGVSAPGSYDDPFGPIDIPPPNSQRAGEKTVAGTSPRTLILAGITLVSGLIAAVLPPPAQHNARNANTTPRTQTEVLTTGAPPPTTNNILLLPISDPGLVGVIVPAPIPMADAQGRPRALPPPNPQDPMKLAAEAVAANRYADAAALYERLAAEHPEAPLFRQFAAVLRARVASMNCQPGAPGCTPPNSPVSPPAVAPRSP